MALPSAGHQTSIQDPLSECPGRRACVRRSFHFDVPASLLFQFATQALESLEPEHSRLAGEKHLASVHRVWMFRDDMEILVTESGSGSDLHTRSASRFGAWDFGVNQRRIQKFITELNRLVETSDPKRNRGPGAQAR